MLCHVRPVIEAINAAISIDFPLQNIEELNALERGFSAISYGRMRGCVGAGIFSLKFNLIGFCDIRQTGDGLVICTRCPTVDIRISAPS